MNTGSVQTLRIDKWLWHARFLKSRSLASKLCQSSKVRINGDLNSKAHYGVKVGDVLTFPLGHHIRVIEILALGERRGPAPEARLLYQDLSPPVKRSAGDKPPAIAKRDFGAGRPTKTDRRAIDKLMGRE